MRKAILRSAGIALPVLLLLLMAAGPEIRADDATAKAEREAEAERIHSALQGPGLSKTAAIELVRTFTRQHPKSRFRPALQFELARFLFREGDYPLAGARAERAAELTRDPQLQEKAYFLAGIAALRAMDATAADEAIGLLEKSARLNGELRIRARLEQAIAMRYLGREERAVALYDDILREVTAPLDRANTLLAKGSALHSLGDRDHDDVAFGRAVEIFDEASRFSSRDQWWEIKTRQAKAMEKGGNPQALKTYQEVGERFLQSEETAPDESARFWFHEAVFGAAECQIRNGEIEPALATLALAVQHAGPRSNEAKERIDKLRLENFIWNPPPQKPDDSKQEQSK